jgi:5-methylthioadenosine/S-adenosylhomocysteine deaminase
MSAKADKLILARWIVPVVPSGTIFENSALVLDGDQIVDILPGEEAQQSYPEAEQLKLPNHLLIPGLINMHGHAAMSLLRGVADDLPLKPWLENHIWPLEKKWVGDEFVRDGTRLACAEMIRCGTSCFGDQYFFPNIVGQVAVQSGMRAQIGFPLLDFPSKWAKDGDEYLRRGLDVHDEFRDQDNIQVAFSPHAPYSVSDALMKKAATLAVELDSVVQIHMHETTAEVNDYLAQHGARPLARLEKMGLIGPRTQCVHMTQVDEQDIELLQKNNSHVIHCPESNLKLASGFCPIEKLSTAGVNVALGTDGAASNNDLNIVGEMRTAALLGKAVAEDASACSAEQVLAMATINAAKALGWDQKIGSLEIGKQADIAAFDLSGLEATPLYNPVSWLVYAASGREVSHLWVAGRALLQDGELQTLDQQDIALRTDYWAKKIRSSAQ